MHWKKHQRRGELYWRLATTEGVYDLFVSHGEWRLEHEGRGLLSYQDDDSLPAVTPLRIVQRWAKQTMRDHATDTLYNALEHFFLAQYDYGNVDLWHVWGSAKNNAADTAAEYGWSPQSIEEAGIAIGTAYSNEEFELPSPTEIVSQWQAWRRSH